MKNLLRKAVPIAAITHFLSLTAHAQGVAESLIVKEGLNSIAGGLYAIAAGIVFAGLFIALAMKKK